MKKHPLLLRFFLFLILPLGIVIGSALFYIVQSLPQVDGQLSVAGLNKPVSISRDQLGIVHIKGETDQDVFFALGYAHAQDRLWQLEFQRRIVQGRLSEVLGKTSVDSDIWFRTLGLYESASKSEQYLSPEAEASLQSYTAGVNAWIDSANVLPPEFIMLDIEPEPWAVRDSLAIVKLFALMLSGNFKKEMSRLVASEFLDQKQMSTIFETYPDNAPVTGSEMPATAATVVTNLLESYLSVENTIVAGGKYIGSNAWVVAPSHTKNGQAIIANDPHLNLQIPSLWYGAKLQGRKINSVGMTLVGLPIVVLGRNQVIAWGGTRMMADNQDLYFEQINSEDSSLYRDGDQWLSFEVRKEKIIVRQDFPAFLRSPLKPIELQVRSTRRGPVISDIHRVFEHPISLRWTALRDRDTSYEALFQLNFADSWDKFKQSLSYHIAPNMNFLYADREGNIGFLGAGQIPIRKNGKGDLPLAGWDSSNHWSGFVPSHQWPQAFNPEQGFIINANNKNVTDEYPYFVSQDWASPARAQRIEQLLREKINQTDSALTVKDMSEIQADTLSLPAKKLLRLVNKLETTDKKQQQALEYLNEWDGNMSRDSVAATIFRVWMKHLRHFIFSDELKANWGELQVSSVLSGVIREVSLDNLYGVLASSDNKWCDDIATVEEETCNEMMNKSLRETIRQLEKLQGGDISNWNWGSVSQSHYIHRPFTNIKLIDTVFDRKAPGSGSIETINLSGTSFQEGEGYLQFMGAGFRQIVALGESSTTHWLMNSTGQSGNIFSKNYDDMVIPFGNVDFVNLEEFWEPSNKTLMLQPAESTSEGLVP
ncbi:penicillin acylase family protein [Pseudoalteromonas maricaloris]|uniref:penicillin acylase family protein n=1 Tax=Pseudoalteromonas maricaloris TaxID=184924 RepID=UPI003C233EBC